MQLSGLEFSYNGQSSGLYGLYFANMDTEPQIRLVGKIDSSFVGNSRQNRRYFVGNTYDKAMAEFDIEIISDEVLTNTQQREISKWLFYQQDFRKLYIDTPGSVKLGVLGGRVLESTTTTDDNGESTTTTTTKSVILTTRSTTYTSPSGTRTTVPGHAFGYTYRNGYDTMDCGSEWLRLEGTKIYRTYLNCRFVEPERIENSAGVYGWKCTVQCDAPMGWEEPITVTQTFSDTTSSSENQFDLTTNNDSREYIYPDVKIVTGSSGGTVTIANTTDSTTRLTGFTNLNANTTFVMHGETNAITNTSGATNNYYELFTHRNFLRLLDGTNRIKVTGDVKSITITYQNMREL